jgi:hypothetical protein
MSGSNHVATTSDVPDKEAIQAAQSAVSPRVAVAMGRHGMIPPVTMHVEVP